MEQCLPNIGKFYFVPNKSLNAKHEKGRKIIHEWNGIYIQNKGSLYINPNLSKQPTNFVLSLSRISSQWALNLLYYQNKIKFDPNASKKCTESDIMCLRNKIKISFHFQHYDRVKAVHRMIERDYVYIINVFGIMWPK